MHAAEQSFQPFTERVGQEEGLPLKRANLGTVQINLGKLCNQACLHCHVDAGPKRTEIMSRNLLIMSPRTAELALDLIRAAKARTVDLTGGAPELNPSFRFLVEQNRQDGRHVLDRCNLTVLFESGQEDLAEFLAKHQVEIFASLPCYSEENVTAQRGQGVYEKSIHALRQLNALGYGQAGSGLVLNLIYNPVGAWTCRRPQQNLEEDYKRELGERFGLTFNNLLTITNMPIARFAHSLERDGKLAEYMGLLAQAFNPATLDSLMCRHLVSISWDGYVYDCDFNQMLDLRLGNGTPLRLGEHSAASLTRQLIGRDIRLDSHCYGCTAGAGSSCGGALAE